MLEKTKAQTRTTSLMPLKNEGALLRLSLITHLLMQTFLMKH